MEHRRHGKRGTTTATTRTTTGGVCGGDVKWRRRKSRAIRVWRRRTGGVRGGRRERREGESWIERGSRSGIVHYVVYASGDRVHIPAMPYSASVHL